VAMQAQRSLRHRLTGWVAMYALVLHGLLIAIATPNLATAAPPGHEFCLSTATNDGDATDGLPADYDGALHCPLCIAVDEIPLPVRLGVPVLAMRDAGPAYRPRPARRVAARSQYTPHRSRAPPAMA
jgi:DUF2946 family protein